MAYANSAEFGANSTDQPTASRVTRATSVPAFVGSGASMRTNWVSGFSHKVAVLLRGKPVIIFLPMEGVEAIMRLVGTSNGNVWVLCPGIRRDNSCLTARGKSAAAFERRCIPRGLRCSSVEYAQYAPSWRLATRAPRRSRCHAGFHHGLLAALSGRSADSVQTTYSLAARLAPLSGLPG